MLIAELQALIKIVLNLGAIFGLAFMLACTVFVIISIIHGNIRINIVRDETENKEK